MATMRFRSEAGQERYVAAYEKTLSEWSVKPVQRDLETPFGSTHVLEVESAGKPALVLLHGMGVSSTMWAANIEPLSASFHVYAIDTMSDFGRSRPTRGCSSREEYAQWLSSVFDALGLDAPFVAGMSYGGWIGMCAALFAPQRVKKIALMAPAALFAPLRLPFILRGLPLLVWPTRSYTHSYMKWPAVLPDPNEDPDYYRFYDPLIDQMYEGWRAIQVKNRLLPTVFTDQELAQIEAPVLLMVGEQEKIYHAQVVLERAEGCLPNPTCRCIPEASHDLTIRQRQRINQELLDFFSS